MSLLRLRPILVLLGFALLALPLASRAAETVANPLDEVVCRVDGAKIHRRDVESELSRVLPWSSYHGNVDEVKRQTLRRASLQKLIDKELKLADAKQRGVKVSKKALQAALAKVIQRYPDEETFRAELAKGHFTVDDVKEELTHRLLLEEVERQVADADREVGRAEAEQYYQENMSKFREPKRAVVRELVIHVPILNRSEAMWQEYMKKAKDALARIESGEPFEALVAELSDVPAEEREAGGLLGPIHEGRLPAAMDKVVWTLREGEVSNPVEDLKGIYLLKVDHFLPERQVPFAEVVDKLRADLQRSWSEQRVETWIQGLRAKAKIAYLDPSLAPQAEAAP